MVSRGDAKREGRQAAADGASAVLVRPRLSERGKGPERRLPPPSSPGSTALREIPLAFSPPTLSSGLLGEKVSLSL